MFTTIFKKILEIDCACTLKKEISTYFNFKIIQNLISMFCAFSLLWKKKKKKGEGK